MAWNWCETLEGGASPQGMQGGLLAPRQPPGAIGSVEECPWAHVPVDDDRVPPSMVHGDEFKKTKKMLGMGTSHPDSIQVPSNSVGGKDPILLFVIKSGDMPVGPPQRPPPET